MIPAGQDDATASLLHLPRIAMAELGFMALLIPKLILKAHVSIHAAAARAFYRIFYRNAR